MYKEKFKSGYVESLEDARGDKKKQILMPTGTNDYIECTQKGTDFSCSIVVVKEERRKNLYKGDAWKKSENREFVGTVNGISLGSSGNPVVNMDIKIVPGKVTLAPGRSTMTCDVIDRILACKL